MDLGKVYQEKSQKIMTKQTAEKAAELKQKIDYLQEVLDEVNGRLSVFDSCFDFGFPDFCKGIEDVLQPVARQWLENEIQKLEAELEKL